jgi:Transglutaminase-like superfamily
LRARASLWGARAGSCARVMPLRLRDNLHWCDCGGRAVFLDAAGDRYFCLSWAANEAFLRLAAGKARSGDLDHLRPLVSRGMLIESASDNFESPAHRLERPTREFLVEPRPRPAAVQVLKAIAAEMRAGWLLRTRSFLEVIEAAGHCERGRRSALNDPHRSLLEIVSASAAAALFTRAHDRCLVRALAMRFLCSRSGLKPTLVFGVRANPFAAHCWLQLEGAVLVGEFEQARLYTPILVVQ